MKKELAGLTLTRKTSQKELEGGEKLHGGGDRQDARAKKRALREVHEDCPHPYEEKLKIESGFAKTGFFFLESSGFEVYTLHTVTMYRMLH